VDADQTIYVSFEAFTTVMFQVEVFWAVTPRSAVVGYQGFECPCYLQLQGDVAGRSRSHLNTDCQSVLVSSPLRNSWPDVSSVEICVFSCAGASSRRGWWVCPLMGMWQVRPTNQKANYGRSPAQSVRHHSLLVWTIPAYKTQCWKWEADLCIL